MTALVRGERLYTEDEVGRIAAPLNAKIAKQRNEIARLTQALEKATEEKAKLLADLKWIRGEE